MTFATVIGVPAGVLIGGYLGWRSTFGVVALLALLAMAGIGFALPRVPSVSAATLGERLAIARRPDVLATLTQTMLALAGTFTIYTYLAPFLERTAGLTGGAVAAMLLLFGIGGATGNLVGGSLSDRFGPTLVLRFVLSALIALFVALALAASLLSPHAGWVLAPVIAAWGLVAWSFPAVQQNRLVALEPRLAPITLSLNASAIYFGVSLGALVGSLVVAHAPIAELGWAAAVSEALALAGLLFGAARQKAHAQAAAPAKGLRSSSHPQESQPRTARTDRPDRSPLCVSEERS